MFSLLYDAKKKIYVDMVTSERKKRKKDTENIDVVIS